MQIYQDTETGKEWHFDDGVDISSLTNIPNTLTTAIISKPSKFHAWGNGQWVLNSSAGIDASNKAIIMEIANLELKQLRPIREFALGDQLAVDRIAAIDSQISVLRARLR